MISELPESRWPDKLVTITLTLLDLYANSGVTVNRGEDLVFHSK